MFNMKKCFLLIFLLTYCVQSYAQKNIHVGFNLINAHDITQIKDEGNHFVSQLAYRPGFEFRIGHDITSKLSVETGFILKGYKVDFTSRVLEPNFIDRFSGFFTAQIPLRLRARWQIPQSAITISPILGTRIVSASSSRKDRSGSWDSMSSSGSSSRMDYILDRTPHILTLLAEAGTDLEFRMSKRFYLTTGITYLQGFRSITKTTATYDFGNGVVHNLSANARGSYVSVNIGFRYTFNPYWIKPVLQETFDKGPQ